MKFHQTLRFVATSLSAVAALCFAGVTVADPNQAVEGCKEAIANEHGSELIPRLKRIEVRGGSYEAWFNLTDGEKKVKAYCLKNRNKVDVVTSDGKWSGMNPPRPTDS